MSITGVYFIDKEGKDPHHIIRVIVTVYSGIFSLMLIGFFIAQNYMILNDTTSNEHIRHKWNTSPMHVVLTRFQKARGELPSIWERFKYFYFSDKPDSRA